MLFTFPSRYWFAIGLSGVFSLTGWSRQIHAEVLVVRATQDNTMLRLASNTGLSPSMVPHGTGSRSVSREYLALPDGPGRFTQKSSWSALLRITLCFVLLRIPDCHRLWSVFPGCSSHKIYCNAVVLQPHTCRNMCGLGSSPFARHYWGNHCYFLVLQVLRCFSSLR